MCDADYKKMTNENSTDLKSSFLDNRETRESDGFTVTTEKPSIKIDKAQMEVLDEVDETEDVDTKINCRELCKYAGPFYFNSIPLMFNRMNPYLLNMVSLIFVAFYKSATMTAGFGLGNAMFMFIWQTFTQVNGETQGVTCSKAFGSKDWKLMRVDFYRSCFWNLFITIFSAVFYCFIEKILLACGFEPVMVREAYMMIMSMIPALFIQTVNEMIRNYLMSQKVYKPFIWINLVAFAFFPFGGYFIIYKSGWGVAGFGLFKFIVETISMVGLIILLKKCGHPESIKREKFSDIFNKEAVKDYLKIYAKILAGWYAGYLSIEVNTFFCGFLKDNIAMACWVVYMNLFAITWTIGAGLAITTRTTAGMAIGNNKPLTAKKYSVLGFILSNFYAIVWGTLMIIFRNHIASWFSEVPEVLEKLGTVVMMAGVLSIFSGSMPTSSTIFRIINRAGLYSILSLSLFLCLCTGLSAIFLFYDHMGAFGISVSFLIGYSIFSVISWIFLAKFNWNQLKTIPLP